MSDLLTRAAAARGLKVDRRAARPQNRRSAEDSDASSWVSTPAKVSLRDADSTAASGLHFTGVASVTERGYEMWDWFGPYTEIVSEDAFDASLARADLDVPLVLGHDQLRRIARTTNGTLTLFRGEEGLTVDAPNLDPTDADVAYIAPKLRAGLIDEMSFAFRIDAGEWSPDYTQYRITQADIHRGDTAIVGYGANPATSGGLRASGAPDMRRVMLEAALAF